mgnify:FL=1
MHRIDSPNRAQNLFGTGKDGYTEGNPGGGIPATETTAAQFNTFLEELCKLV